MLFMCVLFDNYEQIAVFFFHYLYTRKLQRIKIKSKVLCDFKPCVYRHRVVNQIIHIIN